MDPGQPVRGVIAYDFVNSTFENGFDRTSGTMMHPVTEFEIAERKLSVIDMVIKCVEFRLVELIVLPDLGIKSFQCFEEVPLVRIIQRFTKVQIL
jgi:hypothetical protein